MKKLVLIGGGENGRPGYNYETHEIDKRIVELTNKKTPNFLFIGFALAKFEESYFQVISDIYNKRFKCNTNMLSITDLQNKTTVKNKISNADIIYVGSGNTMKLLKYFTNNNLSKLFKISLDKGTVLCGISAGAICWCKGGLSDSISSNDRKYSIIDALNYADIILCPHYSSELERKKSLKTELKRYKNSIAIALDNGSALEIVDNKYKVVTSLNKARARLCYYANDQYYIKELNISNDYRRLDIL